MRKYLLLCFVLVNLFFSFAFAQTVTKYAGTAETPGTNPLTGGFAKDVALFNQPYSCAVDGKGNMWISDRLNHSIRLIQKSDLKVYTRAGFNSQGYKDATGTISQFDNPMGIAIGPANEIYVADNGNYCIRKISAFGNIGSTQTITTYAGKLVGGYPAQGYSDGASNQAMFSSPTDIAVDAAGNLYVADAGNNAIRKITPAGVVSTIAGGPSMGGYQDGTLATAKFSYPTGVFVSSNGDIYVADKNNQKIRKISGNTVTTVITGSPLWSPDDLVVASNGDIYISDQHRILKHSGSSTTVFAGNATLNQSGYANGDGTAALFNNVKGLMYSSSENSLYVADIGNHVIRNITLSSTSTPPVCSFTADKTTVTKSGSVNFTDHSTNNPTSRKWTFTGGSPSTSTSASQSVTYSSPGSYSVKLVVSNADGTDSLTKNSYITVTNSIGIDDKGNSSISLYPSPATEMLYLNPGNNDFGNATLMITSVNGKYSEIVENSLKQNNVIAIPVSDLQSGVYLLVIKTSADLYRFRFVKQ